jgi:hypothetical protein
MSHHCHISWVSGVPGGSVILISMNKRSRFVLACIFDYNQETLVLESDEKM